jgi:hypothetical protein
VTDVPLPRLELALPARAADPVRLALLAARHELTTPIRRVEAALVAASPRQP